MAYQSRAFEGVVSDTVKLFKILKNMGVHDHNGEWLQFLHWDLKMNNNQKQARILMDKIARKICEENNQISSQLIHDRVIYNLIQKAIYFPSDYPDFPMSARQEIKNLFDYKAIRIIDIPLVYLVVENKPVKFGLISIFNITVEDQENHWWNNIIACGGNLESVRAYARINSPGDLEKSLENSQSIVNDMILFLRAISFPITTKPQNQFGLLNEYSSSLALPSRIDKPKENMKLEYHVRSSTTTGPGRFSYEIEKNFLNQIRQEDLARVQKLIEEDYIEPSTELKRKFFLGLRWLGEATKPDVIESRFVKLFFSLEGLIGGKTRNSRDTKFTLANTCAFIAGKDPKEKDKIYNAILRYYLIRSKIVHGTIQKIKEDDFANFGNLIRNVAWSLLQIIGRFETINELHDWASGTTRQSNSRRFRVKLCHIWQQWID
jgi:hypothetical protein